MSRATVLLVYHRRASWIQSDVEILQRHYDVLSLAWNSNLDFLRLVAMVLRSDIVLTWFAYGHSLAAVALARLLRRKCIAVAGGGEVTWIPEIGYGAQGSFKGRVSTKLCLQTADIVIAVSRHTASELIHVAHPRKLAVVHNAVDVTFFSPNGERRGAALTVSTGRSRSDLRLKGVDIFLEVAKGFPTFDFFLVGTSRSFLARMGYHVPDNVCVLGWVDRRRLRALYRMCKVYCQLSFYESFGLSLAEAMASGCVPVVSDRGALPEVVGDCGYVVPYGDIHAICSALLLAMTSYHHRSPSVRRRIVEHFSLDEREKKLLTVIRQLGQC
jgi:glycosyltransferase involved in cell wall biosynthesis